jgi:hypothetical protein
LEFLNRQIRDALLHLLDTFRIIAKTNHCPRLARAGGGATCAVLSLGAAIRRLIRALPAISSARASFTLASIALPVNALIETGRETRLQNPISASTFLAFPTLTGADLLGR